MSTRKTKRYNRRAEERRIDELPYLPYNAPLNIENVIKYREQLRADEILGHKRKKGKITAYFQPAIYNKNENLLYKKEINPDYNEYNYPVNNNRSRTSRPKAKRRRTIRNNSNSNNNNTISARARNVQRKLYNESIRKRFILNEPPRNNE